MYKDTEAWDSMDVWEKAPEAQGEKWEITEEEAGSVPRDLESMTCYHPHAATQGEASFSPLLSLTPQRGIKDRMEGWERT